MYLLRVIAPGLLAGIGILVAPLWFCSPIGLGLCIYHIWYEAKTSRGALLYGGVFGFCTAGAGLLSLWEIVPPHATEVFPTFLAVGFLWLVPTIALGAVSVVFAYLLFLTRKNTFAPIIAVGAFVLHEYARMAAWTLATYGRGATTEPHLSITALGYALADNSYLLQNAAFGGLLALTLTTVVLAVALAMSLRFLQGVRTQKLQTMSVLIVAGVAVVLPLFTNEQKAPLLGTKTIAVFATNVQTEPVAFDTKPLLQKIASSTSPDIILLPEGKTFQTIFTTVDEEMLLRSWFATDKEILTVRSSETTETDGNHYNTIFYESSKSGVVAKQHKVFLMPQGEYLPYLSQIFFSWLPNSPLATIPEEKAVVHGRELTVVPFGGMTLGALICSELFSPTLYNRLAGAQGATVLINIADPQWFQGSHMLFRKTIQIAKVHAVQNRSYFLAAQNSAPSYGIDPRGRVIAQTAWGATNVLLVSVPVPLR